MHLIGHDVRPDPFPVSFKNFFTGSGRLRILTDQERVIFNVYYDILYGTVVDYIL